MSQTNDGLHRHVLLGNGFTIAAGVPDFNDQALLGQTLEFLRRKQDTVDIAARISQIQSSNIEDILGHLQNSGAAEQDLQAIREGFIWSVERLHPSGWTDLDAANACLANRFLVRFQSVFTTNYDRLLYWTINHPSGCHTCGHSRQFGDGFRRYSGGPVKCDHLCFREDFAQSLRKIHHLHGALHYFEENGHIHKRQAGRYDDLNGQEQQEFDQLNDSLGFGTDDTLGYRLFVALQSGRFPVSVTEGDAASKLRKIKSNRYLRSAFRALSRIGGHLFIYGSAIREEDIHLWLAITGNPRIKSINVSVFDQDTGAIERANNLLRPLRNRPLRFYDAESTRIWQS